MKIRKYLLVVLLAISLSFLSLANRPKIEYKNPLVTKTESYEQKKLFEPEPLQITFEGKGNSSSPYLIKSAEDMNLLSDLVEQGNTFENKYFLVVSDSKKISLGNFKPIGSYSKGKIFAGSFNGDGVKFEVAIDRASEDYVGLFGYIYSSSNSNEIKNFSVSGSIKGKTYVGSIGGYLNRGTVSYVYSNAIVEATEEIAGGLFGNFYRGYISHSVFLGEVYAPKKAYGLIGNTYQSVSNSIYYSYASAFVNANESVDGIENTYSGNTRSYVFYDITKYIFHNKDLKYNKITPISETSSTYGGKKHGDLLKNPMNGFTEKEITGGNAYYQIPSVFANHENNTVKEMAYADFLIEGSKGLGIESNPYILENKQDILKINEYLKRTNSYYLNGYYFKIKDGITQIDLGNIEPIGNGLPFYGVFDGNDTIFNVQIESTASYTGLFYTLYGTVKNLGITGSVKGVNSVGAIVGYLGSPGKIENVYNKAIVTGEKYIGGLVGTISGSKDQKNIFSSYNVGDVTGKSEVGGLVGYISTGGIFNSYNRGTIIGDSKVGGIAGSSYYGGSVKLSGVYNASKVFSKDTYVNGFIPYGSYDSNFLVYDGSIIIKSYLEGYYKPSSSLSSQEEETVQSVTRDTYYFFAESNKTKQFNPTYYVLKSMEGNIGFYPQIKIFTESKNPIIVNDSLESVKTDVSKGVGSKHLPFLIFNEEDMRELSTVTNRNSSDNFYGFYLKVADGVTNFELDNFTPISHNTSFYGNFDGNGANFNININIEDQTKTNNGLFGYIYNAEVKNLSITGTIKGTGNVGPLAGLLYYAKISNVYTNVKVEAKGKDRVYGNAGGLAGSITGRSTVSDVITSGEIISEHYAGGIMGHSNNDSSSRNSIERAFTFAKIMSKNYSSYGIVGTESSSGYNTRNYVYYDTAVIQQYKIAKGNRPDVNNKYYGRTTSSFFEDETVINNLGSNFILREKTDDYAYYPQLKYFAEHSNQAIANRSLNFAKISLEKGLGSEKYPFLIKNVDDLNDLRERIALGNNYRDFYVKVANKNSHFVLNDFSPLSTPSFPFTGHFDGNFSNFEIYINAQSTSYLGLFGYAYYGSIKNLYVTGEIIGYDYVGGVVGHGDSGLKILNVFNKASITANDRVGGILGYFSGDEETTYINDAFNIGKIVGRNNIGGIVGHYYNGKIDRTYNRGEIIAKQYSGAIVGYIHHESSSKRYSRIHNSYSSGVTSDDYTNGYALYGYYNSSTYKDVQNSYFDISVMATYDQPKNYKPSITDRTYGRYSSFFFDSELSDLNFSETYWVRKKADGNIKYYPELAVFANSDNPEIVEISKKSVTLDMANGDGSEKYPFLVKNNEDLKNIQKRLAKSNYYKDLFFKVPDGINEFVLGSDYIPIGTNTYFYGNFDGNYANFVVDINLPTESTVGLFGNVYGKIRNLSVSGSIVGKNTVGGIAGYLGSDDAVIENVYNTAKVVATNDCAGGIVGNLYRGLVSKVINTGEVVAERYAGGLVGKGSEYRSSYKNTLEDSYNIGPVSSNSYVYGIVGYESLSDDIIRQRNYYDSSVIAKYNQPKSYKPSTTENNSKPTEFFITEEIFNAGLSSSYTHKEKTKTLGYYPLLNSFFGHKDSTISNRILTALTVDISNGVGTEKLPFLIKNEDDILNLAKEVKRGNNYSGFFFKVIDGVTKFELNNFKPIGGSGYSFYGNFDGNFAEFNINIDDSSEDFKGLFGYHSYGKIKNLYTTGSIKGSQYVGGVVGYSYYATVENVYNLATVEGRISVGGIAGYSYYNKIYKAFNNGKITALEKGVGGISGYIDAGEFENIFNAGEIKGSNYYTGGLIGEVASNKYKRPVVKNGYNVGKISSKNNTPYGLIGNYSSGSLYGGNFDNLFYDTNPLLWFQQQKDHYKPEVNLDQKVNLDTSHFIFDFVRGKLDSSIWEFNESQTNEVNYPQLKVFKNNKNLEIQKDSNKATLVNVEKGYGNAERPFLISSKEDMDKLSKFVTLGNSFYQRYFKVSDGISEIDLGNDYIPIGTNTGFYGDFNGNGANFVLDINMPEKDNIGLFSLLYGKVHNLSVSGSVIGRNYVGGIVGYIHTSNAVVEKVYNTAKVEAIYEYAGGIAGHIKTGTISKVFNAGEILAKRYAGGIVGKGSYYNDGYSNTIEDSFNKGLVSADDDAKGIIGYEGHPSVVKRNRNFYDTSVISKYEQPKKYKPSTSGEETGKPTEFFITEQISEQKFSTEYTYKEKTDLVGYYPILTDFLNSSNKEISDRILNILTVDISNGVGTEKLPYLIKNEEDILNLVKEVNNKNNFYGFYFKVADGVKKFVLNDYTPIGKSIAPFHGNFDGNFAEFNITINGNEEYQGLFGYHYYGTIKNLYVTGSIKGSRQIGGVVGSSYYSTIENVYNLATIQGESLVGGIVGYSSYNKIYKSYNNGKVIGTGEGVGGIVGYMYNVDIDNVFNAGEIIGYNYYTGGLIGRMGDGDYKSSKVKHGYNSGKISASNSSPYGLIAYFSESELYNGNYNFLYYDINPLLWFEQQEKYYKPDVTPNQKVRLDTSYFISDFIKDKFDSEIWEFNESETSDVNYPQLKVFKNNPNTTIQGHSFSATRTNVEKGFGNQEKPYIISNKEDMDKLSKYVSLKNYFYNIHFKVADGISEIDLDNFTPIGSENMYFSGNFDGNGVNFKVNINLPDSNYVGIFGNVNNSSVYIKNFSVSGSIIGKDYVGSAFGRSSYTKISNIYNTAQVEGNNFVGGIAGGLSGSEVKNVFNKGTVLANEYAGGLVGETTYSAKVYDSYNFGMVASDKTAQGIYGIDNGPSRYYSSFSSVYYDLSVIGKQPPLKKSKPYSYKGASYSKDFDFFIQGNNISGFVNLPKTETTAYYLQLKYFAEHENPKVVERSKEVTIVDISAGIGTAESPYLIRNKDDFDTLRQNVKNGANFQDNYFKVVDGMEEMNLGNFEPVASENPFYGNFDGNNVQFIVNIDATGKNYVGLFGKVYYGTIKNFSIRGTIKGNDYVGGIAGHASSSAKIENVYSLAEISGNNHVGGIVGNFNSSNSHIKNAFNNGKIIGNERVGGIVGSFNSVNLYQTYNRGEVIGERYVGGIAGITTSGGIYYSYSTGKVCSGRGYVGGIYSTYESYSTTISSSFYEIEVLKKYDSPKPSKPYTYQSSEALNRTDMIARNLYGKINGDWKFIESEGNVGYFPQLEYFATNKNKIFVKDSLDSVLTTSFLGEGTEEYPYVIKKPIDFINLSNSINDEFRAYGTYYIIDPKVKSFDLTEIELKPIGNITNPFKGHLNGNFADIKLAIDSTENNQGLFGVISQEATIKNLSISGKIKGNNNVGSIVGINNGTISNVYSTAEIIGNDNIGSITGTNNGDITLVYNVGSVTGNDNVGGIVGYNTKNVKEVYNASKVLGNNNVGGVIGNNEDASNVANAYYDKTLTEYHKNTSLNKPQKAIGNIDETDNVKGLIKRHISGGEIIGTEENKLNFNPENWTLKEASGMYDYYPQLKLFAEHKEDTIRTNSYNSVTSSRFSDGDGSEESPFIITDEKDLQAVATISRYNTFENKYFKVKEGVKEFRMEGKYKMYPIGSKDYPFKGHFDGSNAKFIFTDFYYYSNYEYRGLFGKTFGSTIKNIVIEGKVPGSNYAGGVVGYAEESNISNVINTAQINGSSYVGGIAGYTKNSTILDSLNTAQINGSTYVGGIVSYAEKTEIKNAINRGEISGSNYVGGIAGNQSYGKISNTYNVANLRLYSSYLGGIVGISDNGEISNSFNSGKLTGGSTVGGVIGQISNGKAKNLYNRGTILDTSSNVGGIIGYAYNSSLTNSYSASIIRSSHENVGGLVGYVTNLVITNSYYDSSVIEADYVEKIHTPKRSVSNMLDQSDVLGVNIDKLTGNKVFASITLDSEVWELKENTGINVYYPQLKVFAENTLTQKDSLKSVESYTFTGLGTEDIPYLIVSEYDMAKLSKLVSEGTNFEGKYFKVRKNVTNFDLTIDGLNYKPIGTEDIPFEGHFDGNGADFKLNINGENNQGLFGYLGEKSSIKHLSVSGKVIGNNNVGSIAGYNKGTIDTVYSTAKVEGNENVGGIIGNNSNSLKNYYYIGSVKGNENVGGLIGNNSGKVEEGYIVSTVSATGVKGYLIGIQTETGSVKNSYYNQSILDIFNDNNKPTQAISNYDTGDDHKKVIEEMTSGKINYENSMTFNDRNNWKVRTPFGFNMYYPEIKYFAEHENTEIRSISVLSITTDRFTQGDGTKDNPYIIRTAMDMKAVAELVSTNRVQDKKYFKVADDVKYIDLSAKGVDYFPIGLSNKLQFEGHFDGNGVEFNVNFDQTDKDNLGVFGYIGKNGEVKNFSVKGSIKGRYYIGAVAAYNYGLVEKVYNKANIQSYGYTGGIVGNNYGKVSTAFNMGDIYVSSNYGGGIVGYHSSGTNVEISNTYNVGKITGNYIGGIAGALYGYLSNSYNSSEVSGYTAGYIAGITYSDPKDVNISNTYYNYTKYLFSNLGQKAGRAISNIADASNYLGVTTSKLIGFNDSNFNLDKKHFDLKNHEGYNAFLPELKYFMESTNDRYKEDSLNSIKETIYIGEGTKESPYMIVDNYDMHYLSQIVLENIDTNNKYYKIYAQDKLIKLNVDDFNYLPIGNDNIQFEGNFDGNNATFILDLKDETKNFQGLFGNIGTNGVVSNLTIEGNVKGDNFVGGVAGSNSGNISNVVNKANIKGKINTGGISGSSNGIVNDAINYGVVLGNKNTGGILGTNKQNGQLEHSYNMANITSTGDYTAGLIGYAEDNTTLNESFNHGLISSNGMYTAGLVSFNSGTITNSYNTANITALKNSHVAGIAAINNGTIDKVYSSGIIQGTTNTSGIVSQNTGTIKNAYYDTTIMEYFSFPNSINKVTQAIFNTEDTDNVKGLALENMTGTNSIGETNTQMNFVEDNWVLKDGSDFTSYFPELKYFNSSLNNKIKADSLLSITNKKIVGEGTEKDPYLIFDGFDMIKINTYIVRGITFSGKYFKVADGVSVIDLTLPELSYKPLGDNENYFRGILDGNNVKFIIDLNNPTESYQGIFGTLGSGAVVHDFKVAGQIVGDSYLGSVAGRNYGTIYNVTNLTNITSGDGNDVGGIAGTNSGTIHGSINRGVIMMNGTYAGGIAGQNLSQIYNSYNKGNVTGATSIGGIAGKNTGSIYKVYNMNKVTGQTVIGGISGETISNIYESFNFGYVHAEVSTGGGIAGLQDENQGRSYIYSSYNTGKVVVEGNLAGGIVGYLKGGRVYDTYNAGMVYGIVDIGTIVGQSNGTVERSYYDINSLKAYPEIENLEKPTKAISNYEDNSEYKGLYHGQMIGLNVFGKNSNQMNMKSPGYFKLLASSSEWSYYPQIYNFYQSSSDEVKEDSINSVKVLTFYIGQGTKDDPYIITDESDLIALAESTNSGNTYLDKYIKVLESKRNFDFTNTSNNYVFIPIGTYDKPFKGNFDGSYSNIKLNINESKKDYLAVFGHIGEEGKVSKLSVSGLISGRDYIAGIASINKGLISEVYNQATIIGKNYVAGISAKSSNSIENAYNKGNITGLQYVGGISGYVDLKVNNTYNIGIIYGKENVGAIAGFLNTGLITRSFYDKRILDSYRDNGTDSKKPRLGVANSPDSDTVYGLDKQFMIGSKSIGTSKTQMRLENQNDIWTTTYNTEDLKNYPQLAGFSKSTDDTTKQLSNESTRTTLYKLTYDYNQATANNEILNEYAIKGYHYKLNVPFRYGFVFDGWEYTDEHNSIYRLTDGEGNSYSPFDYEKDLNLKARWKVAEHKVEFVDGNGHVVSSQLILHGGTAQNITETAEKNPDNKYVYFFESWDFDFEKIILKDTRIYGKYRTKDRYYKVTYLDGDDNFFKEVKGEYGQKAPEITEKPRKTYIQNIGYKFERWDYDYEKDLVYSNINIKPIFSEVDRYYKVNFYNGDGTILETQTVEYLDSASLPSVKPTKESTVSTEFTFSNWDKEFKEITQNLDVNPVFSEKVRVYTVTYLDGNGEIYHQQKVEYGTPAPNFEAEPTKLAHDDVAYKFVGWIEDLTNITGDLYVHPDFVVVPRYYNVKFYDGNDQVMKTERVEYLAAATAPTEVPTKNENEKETYTFKAWDKEFNKIRNDLDVKALFDAELKTFNVNFYDGNGEILETQKVKYGMNANNPSKKPTKPAHDDVAYKFTSWDTSLENITKDTDIKPVFTNVRRYYFVTFYGYDTNLVLKTEQVEFGKKATAPVPPVYPHSNPGYENIFVRWDKDFDFIESDLIVKAVYEERAKKFEVTFVNGDTKVTEIVGYGSSLTPPEPHKTNTEQIEYTFVRWDSEDYKNVTRDLVITAIFDEKYNYYIVEFIDGDNNTFESQKVLPNGNAVAPSKVPTKSPTTDKAYVFTEYDRAFVNITSNLKVYAKFREVDRYYQVIFKDSLGNDYSTQKVEYGTAAVTPSTPPKKESTAQYNYTFVKWDKEYEIITSDLIINPIYESTIVEYTVKFYNGDNTVISEQKVKYGEAAIAPADAVKEPSETIYYVFTNWDKNLGYIITDLDVYPVFREVDRYYNVIFMGEHDKQLDKQVVEYGKDAVDPIRKMEIKIIDDDTVYVVTGWDSSLKKVKENRVINAIYGTVPRYYEVNFYHETKDTLIKNQRVEYGKAAIAPDDPSKPSTDDYRYEFIGWDKEFDYVTSNLEILARFNETPAKFEVTFYNGDGSVIERQIVKYGEDAVRPNVIPTKESTKEFDFKFIGWQESLLDVKETREIHPEFEKIKRLYVVRFLSDLGRLLKEQHVEYGKAATAPQNYIIPESTNQFEYVPKWDKEFNNITEDIEVNLSFEEVLRKYTYKFYSDNGDVLKQETIDYGSKISIPENPEKESTNKYVYKFIGWDPVVPETISENMDFYPLFEEEIREYTITYLNGDGSKLFETQALFGSRPDVPTEIPVKQANKQYYYEFRKWEKVIQKVEQDETIKPIFNNYLQKYEVKFIDENDNILKVQMVEYGTGAIEPTKDLIPRKTQTEKYTYTFIGWDKNFSNVTDNMVVKTRYLEVLRKYTYTFYDEDRVTILKQTKAPYGSKIIEPTKPTKEGNEYIKYEFTGWDKVIAEQLTEDIKYYAVYKELVKEYDVIFLDGDGLIFDMQKVGYKKAAREPEGKPTKKPNGIYEYEFYAWDKPFDSITENTKIQALFKERLRRFKVTFIYDNNSTEVMVEYGKSAVGKVPTPHKIGYRFVDWDKDLTRITEDTITNAKFAPNYYNVNFHGNNNTAGEMESTTALFDSTFVLPKNLFTRRGYNFAGWTLDVSSNVVNYLDNQEIVMNKENMDLYAIWVPIVYNISYELNGGEAINPSEYIVEDTIVLQEAFKKDHKFVGWFVKESEELSIDEQITIIQNQVGNIKLTARYKYDGLIKLKENSLLGMYYAEFEKTEQIHERHEYKQDKPVYLLGMFEGQTLENLRTNFTNENLVFLTFEGEEINDDSKVVATGLQIVIYGESKEVKDRVHMVLKGDTDGDGIITSVDVKQIADNISIGEKFVGAKLIAAEVDKDGLISAIDCKVIAEHISGEGRFWQEGINSTLRE